MAVGPHQLPKALHDLSCRPHLSEVVLLSTCMRTEVYASVSRYHGGVSEIRHFLSAWSGCPPEDFAGHLYEYSDDAAVAHLFRVAGGLDSAVLGEGEILHQIRDAWASAQAERSAGPELSMLFRQAVETGKRVRTETAIARGTTSLSHAALEMATARLGTIAGRSVLIVGAGDMGEALATALAAVPGAGPISVANRTWERAVDLAGRCGGYPVRWDHLADAMRRADVVLSSTGATELLIDAPTLEATLPDRGGRPLLVVDIAVPRDVDPAVGVLDGVTLLDMDDLKSHAEAGMAERRRELPAAEAIVADEVARYRSTVAQRGAAPLVTALRSRAETIRRSELARFDGRLAGLDDRQHQAVEALTKGIVAKLLHEPTVNVKAGAGSGEGELLAAALERLFDL